MGGLIGASGFWFSADFAASLPLIAALGALLVLKAERFRGALR